MLWLDDMHLREHFDSLFAARPFAALCLFPPRAREEVFAAWCLQIDLEHAPVSTALYDTFEELIDGALEDEFAKPSKRHTVLLASMLVAVHRMTLCAFRSFCYILFVFPLFMLLCWVCVAPCRPAALPPCVMCTGTAHKPQHCRNICLILAVWLRTAVVPAHTCAHMCAEIWESCHHS